MSKNPTSANARVSKDDRAPDIELMKKDKAQPQEPNLHKNAVDNAIFERRARDFQAGSNPMHKTPFELDSINNEANRRWDNKKEYIEGIQGVDGGRFPSQRNKI